MRPEVTGRGRAPAYSREQIAQAAVTVADAEGIDAVTMRRVASEIGAGTMSLYRYVRGKDELYALMVDFVCAPDEQPHPHRDWVELLAGHGRSVRALVLAHPWFPTLQAAIPAPTPNMLRGMEDLMAGLDEPGRGIDELLELVTTVSTFAMGFAQNELAEARAVLHSGLDRRQRMRQQAGYLQSLMDTGNYPYLRRIVVDAVSPHRDPQANFERALDRIITGVALTVRSAERDRPDEAG